MSCNPQEVVIVFWPVEVCSGLIVWTVIRLDARNAILFMQQTQLYHELAKNAIQYQAA